MAITHPATQLPPSTATSFSFDRRRYWSTKRLALGTATAVLAIAAGGYALSRSSTPAGTVASSDQTFSLLTAAERVVPASALPGFVIMNQPVTVPDANGWARFERAPNLAHEAARLSRLGYVTGVDEQLHGAYPKAAEAVSVAERFRSATGAQAELAYQYDQLKAAPGATSTFAVGIPGAHAVTVTRAGNAGQNVMFTVGPYYYLVAIGSPSSSSLASLRAQLVSAAGFLYLEVNGCVALPTRPHAD